MSYVHTSVNEESQLYLANERRYNYTTPKSFLEQVQQQRPAKIVLMNFSYNNCSTRNLILCGIVNTIVWNYC